jgi:hypothetical protein
MRRKRTQSCKIRKIVIHNYKAIDQLELDFPAPRMVDDLDIFAMGSKNGLGKTSVLESCGLLFLAGVFERDLEQYVRHSLPVDLFDLIVRCGNQTAMLKGEFEIADKIVPIELQISKTGTMKVDKDTAIWRRVLDDVARPAIESIEHLLPSLVGLGSDPVILPPLLYFHSYRKVREGNPELGMLVEERTARRPPRSRYYYSFPVSAFKLELLRLMMRQANLFERMDDTEDPGSLEKLNELIKRYAGGEITKLRPSPDNTVDFRISTARSGESFTFDGLSSGQKEIISTLFLIWRHTLERPGIVLIDEPELHLNHEWHSDFVQQLRKIAPHNQYIMATHSEDVFASVPEDRRIILELGGR